jgi:hypothetical protein
MPKLSDEEIEAALKVWGALQRTAEVYVHPDATPQCLTVPMYDAASVHGFSPDHRPHASTCKFCAKNISMLWDLTPPSVLAIAIHLADGTLPAEGIRARFLSTDAHLQLKETLVSRTLSGIAAVLRILRRPVAPNWDLGSLAAALPFAGPFPEEAIVYKSSAPTATQESPVEIPPRYRKAESADKTIQAEITELGGIQLLRVSSNNASDAGNRVRIGVIDLTKKYIHDIELSFEPSVDGAEALTCFEIQNLSRLIGARYGLLEVERI